MRVICINDNWAGTHPDCKNAFLPIFGKPYTVVITIEHFYFGKVHAFYELAEAQPDDMYLADHFAPASDIDETEDERYKRREAEKLILSKLTRADIEKIYDEIVNK